MEVRVDEVTRKRWRAAAAEEGLPLSDWIERACNQRIDGRVVRGGAAASKALPGGKVFRGPDPKPGSDKKR